MAHATMGSKPAFTGVPYNPNQIPGLQMWLDGKDPFNTGIAPAASATVGTWVDKSGNGYNATGIANPPYLSGGGVSLNGTTQYFTTNYTNAPTNETAFMIVKYPSGGSGSIISTTNNNGGRIIYGATTMAMEVYGSPGVFTGTANFTAGTTFMYDYAYGPTNISTFLNGTADATVANPPTFYGNGATNIGYYTNPLPAQTFTNASIYEIIIFNTVLTTLQRQTIEGYLAWKWNLQSSLAISHPYYYAAPAVAYPSAPFVPNQIQGLQMWLDGSDPSATGTQPSGGTAVTTWVDKSGNGRNGTGVAGPTYVSGGGIALNGTNQYFTTNYTSAAPTESIFVVYNTNSLESLGTLVDSSASGGRQFGLYSASAGPSLANNSVAWVLVGSYTIATGTTYIAECTYSTSGINLYVSGNPSTNNTTNPGFTSGTTTIGAGYYTSTNGITWFLNGTISEVIIYNTVLTSQQRQAVEGYLAWKWGLRRSLQVTHPYYSIAPSSLYLTTPFNPEQIPGVQIWLDGADPNGIGIQPAASSTVATWADKSGNGLNGAGVASPTFVAGGGIALNGSQSFTVSYSGLHPNETAFVVIKDFASISATQNLIVTNTNDARIFYIFNGYTILTHYNVGGNVNGPSLTSGSQVLGYTYSSSSVGIYTNGTGTTGAGFTSVSEGSITVGSSCVGTIAEVIIFNSSLSTFQRQTMEGYLAWKWGLQTNLPVNHPYYRAAPTAYFATNPFVPSQISGLQMWLDGADPLATGTAPAASSAVDTWSDKSGNGRNGTGVSSPTFVSGGGIALNGTSQYYTTTYIGAPTVETTFVVMKFNNSNNGEILGAINTFSGGRQFSFYQGKVSTANFNVAGYPGGATAMPINTTLLLDYTFTSGTMNFYYNGAQDGTTTGIAYSGSGTTSIGATIYGNSTTLSSPLNGTIYEVIIYNTALTTQERQVVEGYLTSKWSLRTSLPTTHPFRYTAPNASSLAALIPSYSTSYLPGLVAWYDANDPYGNGSRATNSTVISNWFDKSGNSNTMVAAGAPTYTTGSQNGLPGITVSGNSGTTITSYYRAEIAPGTFLAEMDAFVVYKNTSSVTYNTIITRTTVGNGFANPFDFWQTNVYAGLSGITSNTSSYNAFNTNTSIFNINVSQATAATSKITAYTNGSPITFTLAGGSSTWTPSDTGTILSLGTRGDQVTGFNGLFYEVMVFNTDLSTGQRQYVEGYLAWKWGVTLSATHPYYTTAPNINTLFFQPNIIVGLNLWLDGADPLNTGAAPANGTAITTWFDKSPYMLNAIGTGSPSYISDSSSISFNGSSQYYTIPYSGTHTTETAFFVLTLSNSNANSVILRGDSYGARQIRTDVGSYQLGVVSYPQFFSYGGVNTSNTLLEYSFNPQNMYLYVNGNSKSGPSVNYGIETSIVLGSSLSFDTYYYGIISEVIIFNRVLSEFQRQTMEGYLAWKWGLNSSLPATHPYFSVQPTLLTFAPSYTTTESILSSASSYLPLQTDYNDIGTNPQSVTVDGAVTTTQVLGKRCIQFSNTTTDYLSLPIAPTSGMTFAFWFNTTGSAYYTMVGYTTASYISCIQFDTQTTANATYVALPTPFNTNITGLVNLGLNTWNFIALTVNQTTFVTNVYMNGSNAGSATGTGAFSNSPTTVLIGKSGENSRGYSGFIQNFMYFDTILTGAQIATLYEQTSSDLTPPTAASNLSFTATYPTLTLAWSAPAKINSNANAGNNTTSYVVNFYASQSSVTSGALLQYTFSNVTSLTQSITPNSNFYYATVTPTNSGRLGPETKSATQYITYPPSAPTNVTMGSFGGGASISVSWTAGSLATSYNINFYTNGTTNSTNGGTLFQSFTGNTGTSQSSSAGLANTANGTFYYAIVTSVNSSGTASATSSGTVYVIYLPPAPATVTMTALNKQVTTITVNWSAVSTATFFVVDFYSNTTNSTSGGTLFQTLYPGGGSTTSTSTNTLISGNNGTYYYARVTSANNAGYNGRTSSGTVLYYIPYWITGLQLWLDPSDVLNNGGNNPANGTTVNPWYDKTGLGSRNTATLTTAPTVTSGIVNFNGSQGCFQSGYGGSNAAESVFFVGNTASATGPGDFLGTNTNGSREIQISNARMYVKKQGGATINSGTIQIFSGVNFMFSHTFTPTSSSTYINGSNDDSTANPGSYTASGNTRIGFGAANLNGNFVGSIVMFNVALSTQYRQMMEGWLAWRWGQASRLIAGHPYKTAGP